MAAPELGTKQVCPSCEVKFYDLNKRPATCPKCGHSFEPEDDAAISARAKAKEAGPEAEKAEDEEEAAEEAIATDEDEDGAEETITELGDVDEATIPVGGMDDDEDDNGKTVPAGFTEQGVDGDDDILSDDEDDSFDLDVDADIDVDDDLTIDGEGDN